MVFVKLIKTLKKENIKLSFNFLVAEHSNFQKTLSKTFSAETQITYSKLIAIVFPQLAQNPYYGPNIKKLKNEKPPKWRYRWGNYRLFYSVNSDEKIVIVTAIHPRKDAYKSL